MERAEVESAVPEIPSTPLHPPTTPTVSRAPVRKIVSGGRVVPISAAASELHSIAELVPSTEIAPAQGPAPSQVAAAELAPPSSATPSPEVNLPRRSWNDVPASLPPHARFIMRAARRECAAAATSPFAFAKFLALLPEKICGVDFALLLLHMELEGEAIARTSLLDPTLVEAHLERGRVEMRELFSSMCSDMSRRWRSQLGSSRLGLEPLIDQYLISEVDREFQALIGSLLLAAMGGVRVSELPAMIHGAKGASGNVGVAW